MQKNNVKIALIAHKEVPYGLWDDDIYTPIQVGNRERFLEHRDSDIEDNIAEWNNTLGEMTGLYYWWKQHPKDADYVGFCQYRRRIDVYEDDLDKIFDTHDIICASPLIFYPGYTPKGQYCKCHCERDWEIAKESVISLYPEYETSWNNFLDNGNVLFYSNGFVMREADFNKYCEWLFPIFEEMKKRFDFKTPSDVEELVRKDLEEGLRPQNNADHEGEMTALRYQQQILVFLSERLFTLYVFHNFDTTRIYVKRYTKMEDNI